MMSEETKSAREEYRMRTSISPTQLLVKSKNQGAIHLHKGKPHIRVEVAMLVPIDEEDAIKYREMMVYENLGILLDDMSETVEDDLTNTFEADIESITVHAKNILQGRDYYGK